jgi:hypothetical protein
VPGGVTGWEGPRAERGVPVSLQPARRQAVARQHGLARPVPGLCLTSAAHKQARPLDLPPPPPQRCVAMLEDEAARAAARGAPEAEAQGVAGLLSFAKAHRDVIQRWGRFPHRNAVLGR